MCLHLFQGTPDAKPFHSISFPIYDMIAQLVEDSVADGCSVVCIGKKQQHEESDHEPDSSNDTPVTPINDDSGEDGGRPADNGTFLYLINMHEQLDLSLAKSQPVSKPPPCSGWPNSLQT